MKSMPALVIMLSSFSPLFASVAETTLCELTAVSDVIVVAKTEEVLQVEGTSLARATVLSSIKGDPGQQFYFLAESTWTCDITGAEAGETDLLFLTRYRYHPSHPLDSSDDTQPNIGVYREPPGFKAAVRRATGSSTLMKVAWAGRGQMPVRKVDGEDYVNVWVEDVQLPTDVETIDGPDPEFSELERSAPLDHIVFLVKRYLETCGHPR